MIFLLLFLLFNMGIGLWVIFQHFCKTDVPAAIGHTVKFRLLHCLFLLLITWGNIFEKLGVCSMPKFVRFVHDRIPIKDDPNLVVINQKCGTIPVRIYQPKASSTRPRCGIIFFHGGGSIFGSLNLYNGVCCYLSRESDAVVLSIGYRKAPDHRYPSIMHDCAAVSIQFLKNLETYGVDPSRVSLCGDSAGGTIATSLCQTFMTQPDIPKIRAQILIYPYLQGLNFQLPSYQQNKNVPFLTQNLAMTCVFQYLNIHSSWKTAILSSTHLPPEIQEEFKEIISISNIPKRFRENGYQPMSPGPFNEAAYLENKQLLWAINSPLISDNDIIAQLPETLLVSCEFDCLRDDTLLYKKRLEDQGVPVSWHHIEDGFHGVILTLDSKYFFFPCSLEILNIVAHFIKNL